MADGTPGLLFDYNRTETTHITLNHDHRQTNVIGRVTGLACLFISLSVPYWFLTRKRKPRNPTFLPTFSGTDQHANFVF